MLLLDSGGLESELRTRMHRQISCIVPRQDLVTKIKVYKIYSHRIPSSRPPHSKERKREQRNKGYWKQRVQMGEGEEVKTRPEPKVEIQVTLR